MDDRTPAFLAAALAAPGTVAMAVGAPFLRSALLMTAGLVLGELNRAHLESRARPGRLDTRRYADAVRAGVPRAMLDLGSALLVGDHQDPDNVIWIRRAAVLGHRPAMAALIHLSRPSRGRTTDPYSYEVAIVGREEATYWRRLLSTAHLAAPLDGTRDHPPADGAGRVDQAEKWFEAERHHRQAAADGDIDAAFWLGIYCGRRGDRKREREWLRHAARGGNVFASVLVDRADAPTRDQRPSTLAHDLAEAGDVRAAYVIGRRSEDARWLRRAADRGSVDAAYALGRLLDDEADEDDEWDEETAESWLRRAANAGHPAAAFELGLVATSRGEAEWWIDRAAASGHVGALQKRAERTMPDTGGPPSPDLDDLARVERAAVLLRRGDLVGAVEIWERAAAAGDLDATFNLGVEAERTGAPDEARRLLRIVADAGDDGARARYAALLAHAGERTEAERYLRDVAALGHHAACQLGVFLYETGDVKAAWELWHPRASAGHAESAYRLGLLHEDEDDLHEARRWYATADEQEHQAAEQRLGDLIRRTGSMSSVECYWEWMQRWTSSSLPIMLRPPTAGYRLVPTYERRLQLPAGPPVDRPRKGPRLSYDEHEEDELWDDASDEELRQAQEKDEQLRQARELAEEEEEAAWDALYDNDDYR